jgi:hypothetical protein
VRRSPKVIMEYVYHMLDRNTVLLPSVLCGVIGMILDRGVIFERAIRIAIGMSG